MEKEIVLTKEGLETLKKELQELIDVKRPEVIKELVEAREQGDLSENADYDAARNRQAELESRITELETMISKAKIIESKTSQKGIIKLGSTVSFTNLKTKKDLTVKIVGIVEADPFEDLISNESPLAKALLGQTIGAVVEVKELRQPYKVEVKDVK